MTTFRTIHRTPTVHTVVTLLGLLSLLPRASAGTNLMAIGQYGEVPRKRAEGVVSFSQGEVIYQFSEPGFDFGRVVIRSNQSKSLIRRNLFVGFTGDGLTVDARNTGGGGRNAGVRELEIWLRIQGKLRSGQRYEWDADYATGTGSSPARGGGIPAVIPVMWADGEPIGVNVTIQQPETDTQTDAIRRLVEPHGIVTLPTFDRQTGGAWVVLKPNNFGSVFTIRRFSLREIESAQTILGRRDMPIPVRYIPMRDILENRMADAVSRGTEALKKNQNAEDHWQSGSPEEGVRLTSLVVLALAENGTEKGFIEPAMEWLAEQEPPEGGFWMTETIADRLRSLARHGGVKKFSRAIHSDIFKLTNAQFEDGGWSVEGRPEKQRENAAVKPNNIYSAQVISSLREARLAGAEVDNRLWRKAMKYWTRARAFDGGFRETLESYGGVGKPTISAFTAMGAASLIAAVDMASGFGARRCDYYLGSRIQLRVIKDALHWLDVNYKDELRDRAAPSVGLDAYTEPLAFQWLGEASGLSTFHNANHFRESARELLKHYDESTGMFGVRGNDKNWAEPPSVSRTALALSILGSGAAPTIGQRIVVGDDEKEFRQFRGDIEHLVRYLSRRKGRPFNWRRTTIDATVRELVEVPLLLVTAVGPFDWTKSQWHKLREYCFAGGSVVIDVPEGESTVRESVVAALKRTFPEYELRALPPDSPMFTLETKITTPPDVQAIGNGFRDFLFLPAHSWSCQWHLYQVKDHPEGFAFMENLLRYATDGTPLRSSFAGSTYPEGSIPRRSMRATHLEVGGALPAYPNLIETLDRLMQNNYRFGVQYTSDPDQADLLWVSVTGPASPSADAMRRVVEALRHGRFVFIDVVSGREDWDENLRSVLQRIDGVSLEKLRRNDPVYTGEVPGTQGFDVVTVSFRKALHTRFARSGRCDLYSIRWNGIHAGVYSAYDIASGIGYHYYPNCRGPMPDHARQLAMNVCLAAYERSLHPGSTDSP